MTIIHPQYIKDSQGNNTMVILPMEEFNTLLEELEDLEDIRLYDEAKSNDDGTRILLEDYLKKRSINNG